MKIGRGAHLIPDNLSQASDQILSPEECARDWVEADWFRKALKRYDSRLDLIFVKPGNDLGLDPRFYIIRFNEQTVEGFWVVQGEHGEYCEPQERHLERFLSGDAARNPRLADEFRKVREDRMAQARKERDELRREFREKLDDRLKHEFDTQVAITPKMKGKLDA